MGTGIVDFKCASSFLFFPEKLRGVCDWNTLGLHGQMENTINSWLFGAYILTHSYTWSIYSSLIHPTISYYFMSLSENELITYKAMCDIAITYPLLWLHYLSWLLNASYTLVHNLTCHDINKNGQNFLKRYGHSLYRWRFAMANNQLHCLIVT